MAKDITAAQSSDMTNIIEDYSVSPMQTDGAQMQKETEWVNPNWSKYWGYFNAIADLKSAIIMKAIWIVGKGYEAQDTATKIDLELIRGWGKDSFTDVLFNLVVSSRINGDGFAEIIRDEDTSKIINLKPLDPGSIKIVVNSKGQILRYEQIDKGDRKKVVTRFKPEEMFHLCHNRIADQIHGISDIQALENTIKADEENFIDMKKLMHHQVRPFILWKLKTDDETKIAEIRQKIDKARNLGEDMFIPDDDDAVEYEIVQVNVQSAIFEWRNDIRNKFYRTIGLPQVVPGAGGQSTESESKVIYLAFEQIVEKEQKQIEEQIQGQLGIKLNLIPPASLQQNLQQDNQKDGALKAAQPSDTTAGVGR